MLIIGLTGGIASGKSTATGYFRALGVPVIDADEISHELVEPGNPALDEIIAHFGPEFLDQHGHLDRSRLRQLVFSDREQRHLLESILHPKIRHEISKRIANINAPYCIISIPLLVETGQMDMVDRVLVIDAPTELQISRLHQRGHSNDDEIQAMLSTQTSRQERLRHADDIIINDGSLESLQQKIKALHREYLSLPPPSTL